MCSTGSKAQVAPVLPEVATTSMSVTSGPERTFTIAASAAAQLHQTGHSCIFQHRRRVKVCHADKAPVRCGCAKVRFDDLAVSKTIGFGSHVVVGTSDTLGDRANLA